MPLSHLAASVASLDRNTKVAVMCAGGYRSSIGCSLLEQLGFRNVANVVGGFTAWMNAKLPVGA